MDTETVSNIVPNVIPTGRHSHLKQYVHSKLLKLYTKSTCMDTCLKQDLLNRLLKLYNKITPTY